MSELLRIRQRPMPGIKGLENGRVLLEGGKLFEHTTIHELAHIAAQDPTSLIFEASETEKTKPRAARRAAGAEV